MEEEKKEELNKVITTSRQKGKEETVIVNEEGRHIDVDTLLVYNKEDSAVQGINYLLGLDTKCIDKQFIIDSFNQKTGNVMDKDTALEVLKEVLTEAVQYINHNDEFLYIDPTTVRVDRAKSEQKAISNGYEPTKTGREQEYIDKYFRENIIKNSNEKREASFLEAAFRQNKRNDLERFFSDNHIDKEEIQKLNNTEVKEETIGNELYDKYEKAVEGMKKYKENEAFWRPEQIELLKFDEKLRDARNTPRFNEILEKRNELLKNHSELIEFINGKTGLVDEELYRVYQVETKKYNDNVVTATIIKQISAIKEKGIDNLTPEQKKSAVMRLIGGLETEEISEEVSKFLEQLVPGYKHSDNINNKENRIAIEKVLKYDKTLQVEGFEELIKTGYSAVLEIANILEIANKKNILDKMSKNSKKSVIQDSEIEAFMKIYSQDMNVAEMVVEKTGTEEDKYFFNSKIEFSNKDNDALKYLYKKATINTWIQNENSALLLRYECLLNSKEEFEKSKINPEYVQEQLSTINREIKEFENKYVGKYEKLLDTNGKLRENKKAKAQSFAQLRTLSKLTKEFIKDEKKVNSYSDYEKLTNKEKRLYLVNTISALNQGQIDKENTVQEIVSKMANRRLEVLNNNETNFITINSQDDIQIDTNVILNEYNKVSSYKFKSYEELIEFCELERLEYANSKMKHCIEDARYVSYNENETDDEKLRIIEEAALIDYRNINRLGEALDGNLKQEGIDSLELPDEIKQRIKNLEEKIGDEDLVLMEFQRLQDIIGLTRGESQKENIRKRNELIMNNPEKKDEFLAIIDDPRKYSNRLNEYSNNIIAKNVLLTMATINELSEDDLQEFAKNPIQRRKALLTLIGALDGALEDKQDELACAIQKLCPDSRILDENGNFVTDFEILAPMIGKHLGIEDATGYDLVGLIIKSKAIMIENYNSMRFNNQQVKDINQAMDIYSFVDSDTDIKDIIRDSEERYFNNSSLDYSKKDNDDFENLYYKSVSKSWIESKEDAERYRYLLFLKRYSSSKDESEVKKYAFLEKIKAIEKKSPHFKREDFMENGELKPEFEKEITEYTNMKKLGDMMSDYVLDENKINNATDYQNLSNSEKRRFLVRTYLGLKEKGGNSDVINKFAKRRLEIISSEDQSFVKKDKDNNLIMDEKTFFEEFRKVVKVKVENFEQIDAVCQRDMESYVLGRLDRYADYTEENEFVKIGEGTDKVRALKIEKIREKNDLIKTLKNVGKDEPKNEYSGEIILNDRLIEEEKSERKPQPDKETITSVSDTSHNNPKTSDDLERHESTSGITVSEIKVDSNSIEGIESNSVEEERSESTELAIIEPKKSLFGKIVDKVKGLFSRKSNNSELENDKFNNPNSQSEDRRDTNSDNGEIGNVFESLRVDVNVAEAVKMSQNASNEMIKEEKDNDEISI